MLNIGSSPTSLNYVPGLIVQSSSAVRADPMVELYADPTTHRLLVDATTSLATQAIPAAGLTQASAVQIVDGSGNQITSFGGGIQYTDANAAAAHPIGTGIIFNNGGTYNFVSAAQPLPITGSLSITNPSTGAAVPATANYIAGSKAGTLTGLLLGSQTGANSLGVVLASDQAALAVTGTFWQATQPVSGTITANAGANLNTSLLALETGGNLATLAGGISGAKYQIRALTASDVVAVGDGTNTANILKSDGTVAGQNAQIMAGTAMTTGTLTLNAGSPNTVWYDMVNYAWVSVEIFTNTTPSTLTFATSGDAAQTNSAPMYLMQAGNAGNMVSATTSAVLIYHGPRSGRYFRITSNVAGGNTVTMAITFFTNASALPGTLAVQQGTWTVQPGNTANTTAWKVDGSAVTQPVSIATAPALVAGSALIGKVGLDQTTPGTTNAVSLAQIGATTIVTGGVAGTLGVGGNVATNVAIGTNPINLGAQAVSSENTAVTATRMAQLVTDLVGKLIVLPFANPENFVNGTTAAITDTTTTSIIASAGGSLRNYITDLTVTNSHATVGTFVKITDGASTILWEGYAAAAGGGFAKSFSVPLRGTAATAVNAICVTTGANVIVSAGGYKGV